MLKEKITEFDTNVWLINTGWSGGEFGVGNRIKLHYTREMISAVLNGDLDGATFEQDGVFGLAMPTTCPNVPDEILNPRNTWYDKAKYDAKANFLASAFNENFEAFANEASDEILSAAPNTLVY
jgi:phosphoenolpyruvate carboxykinase (ATP)